MPIPPFENHDHISDEILPTGVHAATLSEIEDGLVAAFPDSQRRPALFQGWLMYRSWLLSLVDGQARVFINGSFVTSRLEPSDIDMSIEIELDHLSAVQPAQLRILSYLLSTTEGHDRVKQQFGCDAYLVVACPPDHPGYNLHLRSRWPRDYWQKYKGPDKLIVPGVEKGYIEAVEQ